MSKIHVFILEYCVFRNEMYNLSMDMNQAVAKAIAAERAIAGLTVRQLSAVSGVPVSSLMRILGAEREIKVTQLEQLATAFGITPVDILIRAQEIRERSEARLNDGSYQPMTVPSFDDDDLPEDAELVLAARRADPDSPEEREAAALDSLGEEPQDL